MLLGAICLFLVLIIGYFVFKNRSWFILTLMLLFYNIKALFLPSQEDSGVIEQKPVDIKVEPKCIDFIEQKPVEPRIEPKYIDFENYYPEVKAQVNQAKENQVDFDKLPETVMYIVKTMFLTTELPYPVDKIRRYVNLIIRQAIVIAHPDHCRSRGIDPKKGSAIVSLLSNLKDKANDLLIDDIQDYMIRSAAQEEEKKQGLIPFSWTYGGVTLEESPLEIAKDSIIMFRFFEGDTQGARDIARRIDATKQLKDQSRENAIKHQEQRREAAIKHQEQLRELDMKHQAERQERNNERDALYEKFGITTPKQNNTQVKPIACKLQYEAYLLYLRSIENIDVDMLSGVLAESEKYIDNDCDQVVNIINENVKKLIKYVKSALCYNKEHSMKFMVAHSINSIESLVNELKQDIEKELANVEFVEEAKMQEAVPVRDESVVGPVAKMAEAVLDLLNEDELVEEDNSSNYGSFGSLSR